MTTGRRKIGVALVVAAASVAASAGDARADGAAECVKGSEDGTAARDQGRLREARKHFVTCAADTCPKTLRIDCARWLEDVEASLPTVVFGAHDAEGADVFDVNVFVDGEKVTGHERGKAVALDPGPHVIRFERPPSKPATVKVLLRAGEHNRPILATFSAEAEKEAPTKDPVETPPRKVDASGAAHPVPMASVVLGGIGLVALGSFTFFAITGAQEKERLRGSCSPHCTDAQIGDLKTRYIVADVSLGVGIVALGIATFLWLTEKSPQTAGSYGRFARTIWK